MKDLLFTPYKLENGQTTQTCYGWGQNELHGATLYGHEGQTYGYSAMMMHFHEERLFIAVLSNDDRSHLISLIGSWFRRTDPVCLAGQLATIAMREKRSGAIEQ
jgi:hypothetical protein